MTKEELKREAKEYADKYGKSNFDLRDTARFAYYQGAEPREKRIAELERNVAYYAERAKHAELAGRDYVLKNKDLEKENAELKADNDARKFAMAMSEKVEKQLREENAELKETVIKMNNVITETFSNLSKAKELLERLLITSCNSDVLNLLPNCSEVLRVRVEAEQFINNEGCPNCFCEDCTKEDCNIRKLRLVSNKEIKNG